MTVLAKLTPARRRRLVWRALLASSLCSLAWLSVTTTVGDGSARRAQRAQLENSTARAQPTPGEKLAAVPLSDALRRRGYSECNPYDALGLGPYAPYRSVSMGRIAIPRRGGHTGTMGYDVLVHFHGHTAVRKTIVQVARGIAYVGIDLGIGSGAYSDAFAAPDAFTTLLASITRALQESSGDDRAHIRHLALSAWSAGYGAVNEILKHGDDGVDAVILLDGLHARWDPAARNARLERSVTDSSIAPVVAFARRALRGEKLFVFTHSDVDPVSYPSTHLTADFLVERLGLRQVPRSGGDEPFGLLATADRAGLHIWSYAGDDKPAHCSHIAHIERAVRDILEASWDTPPMARDLPSTPAPTIGPAPDRAQARHDAPKAGRDRGAFSVPSSARPRWLERFGQPKVEID